MKQSNKPGLFMAMAATIGLTITGCQKKEIPVENQQEKISASSISAEKLPKITKFITISFGVKAEEISYDRKTNVVHYGDMQMPADQLEEIYDNANEYKINNEK